MIRRGFLRLMGLGLAAAGCAPTWSAYPKPPIAPTPPAAAPPLWHLVRFREQTQDYGNRVVYLADAQHRVTGEIMTNAVSLIPTLSRLGQEPKEYWAEIDRLTARCRPEAHRVLEAWVQDLNSPGRETPETVIFLAGERTP